MSSRTQSDLKAMMRESIEVFTACVRNAEAWNAAHPDEPPADCEPDRVVVAKSRQCLAWMEAGDSRWFWLHNEIARYARRVLAEERK